MTVLLAVWIAGGLFVLACSAISVRVWVRRQNENN